VEADREGVLATFAEQGDEGGVEVDRAVPVLGFESLEPGNLTLPPTLELSRHGDGPLVQVEITPPWAEAL
jgi:hypothetical protein